VLNTIIDNEEWAILSYGLSRIGHIEWNMWHTQNGEGNMEKKGRIVEMAEKARQIQYSN
jgi:hypothetical protein